MYIMACGMSPLLLFMLFLRHLSGVIKGHALSMPVATSFHLTGQSCALQHLQSVYMFLGHIYHDVCD